MAEEYLSPKTYAVAPGFHYPRGGKIVLGAVFKNALKVYDVPLSTAKTGEGDAALPPVSIMPPLAAAGTAGNAAGDDPPAGAAAAGDDDAGDDNAAPGGPAAGAPIVLVESQGRNWGVASWAKFWSAVKASFSTESAKNTHVVYTIARITTEEFTGVDLAAYIQSRVDRDPLLQAHLLRWPAYMVSGIKYSTGLTVDILQATDRATAAEMAARLHQEVQAGLGARAGSDRLSKRFQPVLEEVVFAYQVIEIRYADKKNPKTLDVQIKKGGLLGALDGGGPADEGDEGYDDEEEEEEEEAESCGAEGSSSSRGVVAHTLVDVSSLASQKGVAVGDLDGDFIHVYE